MNTALSQRSAPRALPDMVTRAGHPVYFDSPHLTPVVEDDLKALARVCRYGGHYEWSVLQHLALCATLAKLEGLHPVVIAHCAAHDLHEAYVGDLVGGLKRHVRGWKSLEAAWEEHVLAGVGLEPANGLGVYVKAVDRLALVVEMEHVGHHAAELCHRHYGREPIDTHRDAIRRVAHMRTPALWSTVWSAIEAGREVSDG